MFKLVSRKTALGCGAAVIALALASSAAAQSRAFDVPAQQATDAIPEFARQAGLQIVAPASQLRGVRTLPLRGTYDPRTALTILLRGTGLEIGSSEAGVIALRRAPVRTAQVERVSTNVFAQAAPIAAAAVESQPAEIEEVVVTGSLIARSDVTSSSPLSVVSEQQIADSGSLSMSEALRRDPALGSGSRGPQNTLNGAGSIGVSLRNLGSRRTLVLVNGRRFPIFADNINNAVQDIGAIPSGLVERVEVLRDGASTTYGADAVAGVVNFVLKDDFDGVVADAYYGVSDRGDGAGKRFSVAMGGSFDRGALMLTAQYQKQDEIRQDQRAWATNLVTSLLGAGQFNSPNTPGGLVLRTNNTTLACYAVTGGPANLAPNCQRYDPSAQSSLILGSEMYSIGGAGHYDLTDNVRLDVQGFFSDRDSVQNISSTQIDTSALTGIYPSITVAAANTNNPYGEAVRIRWRPTQYGPRTSFGSSKTTWLSGGLSGKIFGDFNWSVAHTYGQTSAFVRTTNTPISTSLFNLLNPAVCAADPVCAPVGAIPNIANLLSNQTPLTAAQQAYLFYDPTSNSKFTSQQTLATISGPLFELPAGTVKMAVGLERRKETGVATPDDVTQSGTAIGSFVFPTDGRFTTKEVFGELDIPLLADLPGAKELTLNLQARYSDFSAFGGADTYKVGVNYSPVEDIRVRAAYGTSFRAPDVLELYAGGLGGNASAQDPCNSGAGGLRARNATVAANCLALGVPLNFTQSQTTIPFAGGGNPTLDPEKGRTYTVGVVVRPRFAPDFTLTADYYNIRVRDAVTNVAVSLLQQNLNSCYALSDFRTQAAQAGNACFSFDSRSPSGSLNRVLAAPINLQRLSTSGIDFSALYHLETLPMAASGSLDFGLRMSYLRSYREGASQYVGKYLSGVAGDAAYPRWRGSGQVAYSLNNVSVQWTVNYVDPMDDASLGASVPLVNFLNYTGTPKYFSHDLLVKIGDIYQTDFTIGVNNVFDKDPPYAFVTTRNTLGTTYDQLGRYFFVSAKHRF